jgi:hypothetical protein
MIAEAKNAAVGRGLREAFGVTEFEDIRMLTAGMTTARVFRIVVAGHPYLLRLMMSTDATAGPGQGGLHDWLADSPLFLRGPVTKHVTLVPFSP